METRDVIDRRARLGIRVHQLRAHHRAGEVVRDQAPDDAGLEDVLAHAREPLGVRLEVRGDHVAGLDAALDDLGVARVRRPQRLHARAVHALDEEDLVGRDLQRLEELRREHVAVARDDRDQQPVGAAELLLVVEVGADVLVLERQLLVEVRVELEARHRDPAQRDRDEREDREDDRAVPEDVGLEPGRDPLVAGFPHGATPPGSGRRRTPPSPATTRAPSPEGTTRGDRLAVVLLAELEAAAAVAAHEHHARGARDHHRVRVDARAGVEQRRGAGRDRRPGRAAVLGPEQVAAQPECEHHVAVEREDAVEGAVVGRRQLAPARTVVVGTEQASRFRAEIHASRRPAGDRVQVELEAEVHVGLHLVRGRLDLLRAGERRRLERHLAPHRAAVRRHVDDAVRADRDAAHRVRESDVEERLRARRLEVHELPGIAAVLRAQDGLHVADGPAVPLVGEIHGGQVCARRDRRLGPGAAGVGGMEDVPALAHRDDARTRPGDVEEQRADGERRDDRGTRGRVLRRRVLAERRRRHREGERREREPQAQPRPRPSACRGLRSRPA